MLHDPLLLSLPSASAAPPPSPHRPPKSSPTAAPLRPPPTPLTATQVRMLLAGYIELLRKLILCSRLVMPVVFSHLLPRVACDFLLCSCLLLAALGSRMSSRLKHNTWGKSMLRCVCVEPVSGVGPRTRTGRVRTCARGLWASASGQRQGGRGAGMSSQKE